VVDLFGPTDLAHLHGQAVWWARGFVQLTTGSSRSTRSKASPVTWVAPNDPPFMILQGKDDTAVPASQSEELAERLSAAGVPSQLGLVDHAGHGLADPASGRLDGRSNATTRPSSSR
jgi:dipeptidyl aminopeptidase/acylaminoacyl peptidase